MLLAAATLTFVLAAATPGDPFTEARLDARLSSDVIEQWRHARGLDDPLVVRYVRWLAGAVRGDLGTSWAHAVPVTLLLWQRVPNTLLLALTGLALAWCVAVPLGAWAALAPHGLGARVLALVTGLLTVVPDISLAIAAVALAVATGWAPAGGMTASAAASVGWLDVAAHLTLPAVVLASGLLPGAARHTEASLRAMLESPLPIALEARGIPRRRIALVHGLRIASAPLVTLFALSAGTALGSSMVVETVFGWPGVGPLMIEAVGGRDLPVVVGAVLVSATLLVASTTAGDLLSARLDPRARHR